MCELHFVWLVDDPPVDDAEHLEDRFPNRQVFQRRQREAPLESDNPERWPMSHKDGQVIGALPHAITIATMWRFQLCTHLYDVVIVPLEVTTSRRGALTGTNSSPHPPAAPQDAACT